MKKRYRADRMLISCVCALVATIATAQPDSDCPTSPTTRSYWAAISANRTAASPSADELALRLLPCLGSKDSDLRDTYGYGLFTYWLRNERLSVAMRRDLTDQLLANLETQHSLLRSFSALVLSELLRADAIDPILSAAKRQKLLQESIAALGREQDYRGLDPDLGWVHPIAHLADVLWRFALHPALTAEQANQVLSAIHVKATTDRTSYVFNEGDRLARVASVLLKRQLLPADRSVAWLSRFQSRANGENWGTAFQGVSGMAELHNAKLFIRALHGQLAESELDEAIAHRLQSLVLMFAGLV